MPLYIGQKLPGIINRENRNLVPEIIWPPSDFLMNPSNGQKEQKISVDIKSVPERFYEKKYTFFFRNGDLFN